MARETLQSSSRLSRRAALGGVGAAAVAVGLDHVHRATAQEGDGNLAGHPLVGAWAAMTPGGVVPQTHGPDGSIMAAFPPNYVDPVLGLTFQGPALGRWESTSARAGRFTFLQALSDGAGAYVGTFQLAADIEASEDGQSWSGTAADARHHARRGECRHLRRGVADRPAGDGDPHRSDHRVGRLPSCDSHGGHRGAVAGDAGTVGGRRRAPTRPPPAAGRRHATAEHGGSTDP